MKKQTRFALFLLIIAACSIIVLVVGIIGLQNLTSQTQVKQQEFQAKVAECNRISEQLAKRGDWELELASLNTKLATLDKELVEYKYIPTYLEQIQHTTLLTGNTISSIRPRSIEPLDSNSPLLMASYERWLEKNPDIAAAAKESDAGAEIKKDGKEDENAPQVKKPSEYKIQQFTLEIEGDYTSVVRLLDALRNFPKLIYVHSVSVAPKSRDNPDRLKAMLETYAIIPPDHYRPDNGSDAQPVKGMLP